MLTQSTLSRVAIGAASRLSLLGFALLVGAASLNAQANAARGTLTGTVRDSLGVPIAGAEIVLSGGTQRTESNDGGTFRVTDIIAGPVTVRVRRIGFRPVTAEVQIEPAANTDMKVTVTRVVQELSTVLVRGERRVYTGRMAGFYQRRDLGHGHFFTRAQLERQNAAMLTDVMRRVPGVRLVNTRLIRNAVRFRGNLSCSPLVWVDGSPLSAAEFDLDGINPLTIEGMEIYSGVSTIPTQFMGMRGIGNCGVIVIWTRSGEPRRRKKKNSSPAAEVAMLVSTERAYTADNVDVQAHMDSLLPIVPVYPDSLHRAMASGLVVAEFVVATNGEVDMETFSAISSSHPAFTEAVRRALTEAVYIPAVKQGRAVAQVVQQPFRFEFTGTGAQATTAEPPKPTTP